MIVSCPDCGTLYRCAAASAASRGRCSYCGCSIPVTVRQQYAVQSIAYAASFADPWTGPERSFRDGRRPTATVDFPGGGAKAAIARARTQAEQRSVPGAEPLGAGWSGQPSLGGIAPETSGSAQGDASSPLAPGAAADSAGNVQGPAIARRSVARTVVYVVSGMAAGALAGFAGASWFGGSAIVWSAGGALAGAGSALGVRGSWTSRND